MGGGIMTIKYAIFDPLTGEYTRFNTPEERKSALAEKLINFYLHYASGQLYSVIEIHEDGSETWRNPQGDEIENQEELRRLLTNNEAL